MENGARLVLKPNQNISYYFIRNIWMFFIYLVLVLLSFVIKINLSGKAESIVSIGDSLVRIISIIGIVVIGIVYLYKTVQLILGTRKIQCTFYDTFMRFEDNFLNKHSKDINYDKISEVSMHQNIWDRVLKTGIIHIKTNVESDVGIFIPYINMPSDTVKQIQEIINDESR